MDAFDVVFAEDLRQLIGVVALVELGAADEHDAVFHEPPVEISMGKGGAVGRDEQMRAVKIGRVHRYQLQLYRPLAQFARHLRRGRGYGLVPPGMLDRFDLAARTAAGQRLFRFHVFRLRGEHRRMVVGGSLPLLKGDRTRRTGGQAVPQAVAVVLPQEPCLPVHHADRALVAGVRAQSAAVAFLFVYRDDSAFHCRHPPFPSSG